MRCTKYDGLQQRDQEKTEAHQRVADAMAPAASGRLAGAGYFRRLFVRHPVTRPRSQSLSGRVVRVGQPILFARRVARRRATHRPGGPSAPRSRRSEPPGDRTGFRQEQARSCHRERQVPFVQHLHVWSPDQALRLVQ